MGEQGLGLNSLDRPDNFPRCGESAKSKDARQSR